MRARQAIGLAFLLVLAGCGDRKISSVSGEPIDAIDSLPVNRGSRGCDNGVKAFEASVHKLLRQDCIGCHDTGGIGPAHSVAEPQKSYGRILAYVDWRNIDGSRLVTKGGNQHCLQHPGGKCTSTQADIKRVLKEWWENGQKDCPNVGRFVTKPVPVPDPLPKGPGAATMRWQLGSIDPSLAGASLEMEILQGTRAGRVEYVLRKPRLTVGKEPVRFSSVNFLVNGKHDYFASVYTLLDAHISLPLAPEGSTLSPVPVLSSVPVIVGQDQPTGDEISLAFEMVEVAPNPDCRHIAAFENDVLPVFQARRCYSCHGGGPDNLTGRAPANEAFPMRLSMAKLCSASLQRSGVRFQTDSPLISFPLKGSMGHPRVLLGTSEIHPAWTDWLRAEKLP